MLSRKELEMWCKDMLSKPHRLVVNDENYYCMKWDDGTTYEWKCILWDISRKITHIFINHKLVYIYDGE